MSIFGVLITYACSWWLVLFMVLPWRVKIAENPMAGVAASAPVKPMLKRKIFITTLLAILPTVFLYFYIGTARAAEADMYHTGDTPSENLYHAKGGCHPDVAHKPAKDVAATDSDATIKDSGNIMGSMKDVYVGIDVPTRDYTGGDGHDLRDSDVYVGAVKVGMDGSTSYNGQPISQQNVDGEDCK